MNSRDYAPWLLPFLATLAFLLAPRGSLAPRSPAAETVAPSTSAANVSAIPTTEPASTARPSSEELLFYEHNALSLLAEFFESLGMSESRSETSVDLSVKSNGSPNASSTLSLKGEFRASDDSEKADESQWDYVQAKLGSGQYELHCIVAGIPDPSQSRLEHDTDRELDAIQRAAEAADRRYVLDRYYLPWPLTSAGSSSEVGNQHPEHTPGLMLLRGEKTPQKRASLTLVFLAGETPTSGVDKLALTRSIAQIVALSGAASSGSSTALETIEQASTRVKGYLGDRSTGADADYCSVSILGPHFTGAIPSYDTALREWKQSIQFRLVSGSASGITGDDFEAAGVHFKTTVWSDPIAIRVFVQYVANQFQVHDDEIALLTEAGTGYGQAFAAASTWASASAPSFTSSPDVEIREPSHLLGLSFPLHISRLRNLGEQTGPSQLGLALSVANRSFVPLSLEQTGRADTLPSFSGLERSSNARILAGSACNDIPREDPLRRNNGN